MSFRFKTTAIDGAMCRLVVSDEPTNVFAALDVTGAPIKRGLLDSADDLLLQIFGVAVWIRRDGGAPEEGFGTKISDEEEYIVEGQHDIKRLQFVRDGTTDVRVIITPGKYKEVQV